MSIDLKALATLGIGAKPATLARFGYWFTLGAVAIGSLPTAGCSLVSVSPVYQISSINTAYAAQLITPFYQANPITNPYSIDAITPAYRLVSLSTRYHFNTATPITTLAMGVQP
jgi:hypothetical protein